MSRNARRCGIITAASHIATVQHKEDVMAKGQMRSNKEKKKPKADKNKKQKGGATPSPFAGQSQGTPSANPYGKKG
jgi:hypothetical protein